MRQRTTYNIDKDLWLQQLREELSEARPKQKPDVTQAVMQSLKGKPAPILTLRRRRRIAIVTTVAAACLTGLVAITAIDSHTLHAAPQQQDDLSYRLYNIYSYCNAFGEDDEDEESTLYDNPVYELF